MARTQESRRRKTRPRLRTPRPASANTVEATVRRIMLAAVERTWERLRAQAAQEGEQLPQHVLSLSIGETDENRMVAANIVKTTRLRINELRASLDDLEEVVLSRQLDDLHGLFSEKERREVERTLGKLKRVLNKKSTRCQS